MQMLFAIVGPFIYFYISSMSNQDLRKYLANLVVQMINVQEKYIPKGFGAYIDNSMVVSDFKVGK